LIGLLGGGAACGSGSHDKQEGASDAATQPPADAGPADAGPPTTMRVIGGRIDVVGAGPRAGGTMRLLQDDFETNRTCGGTVCVTGGIEP
jgi:hypothetical protein